MSTFRTPVGPQPSRVYWRRRLVVLLGLVAVIVIIILIVARPPGTATPAGANSNSPSAPLSSPPPTSPAPTNAAPVNADDVEACDLDKVKVTALTDETNYDEGENPELSFSIKSSMTKNCSIDAGSDVQEYRITSGDELIWTSTDCQEDPVEAKVVLEPGKPIDGASLTWDRTRSDKDTCEDNRDEVIAGGASYHFEVRLGDDLVSTDKQFLLN